MSSPWDRRPPPKQRTAQKQQAPPPAARLTGLGPARALALPLTFTLLLVAFALLPTIRHSAPLLRSFLGAGAALLAWNALLLVMARRRGRSFTLEVVLRRQHYLQACAQGSVLLYWCAYWQQPPRAALL